MNLENKTIFSVIVRSTHVDQFSHLNNSKYSEFFEWARWDWGFKNDIDFEKMLKQGKGPVVVHLELDFLREVKFKDKLTIETVLDKYSNKSFTLRQTMFDENKIKVSECSAVVVFVDADINRAVPIPDDVRNKFIRFINK